MPITHREATINDIRIRVIVECTRNGKHFEIDSNRGGFTTAQGNTEWQVQNGVFECL